MQLSHSGRQLDMPGISNQHRISRSSTSRTESQNLYYRWSKDFLEAGKKWLAGERAATSDEVKDLRREASALKEVVAELTLENRLLKKSMTADGRSNRGKRLRREDAA